MLHALNTEVVQEENTKKKKKNVQGSTSELNEWMKKEL